MIYFIGKVGATEHGNTRSAKDVIKVFRESGNEVKILTTYRKKRLKSLFIKALNLLRKTIPHTTVVNGLGGMRIYDDYYRGLKKDVLIVRESPAHFKLKGDDPLKYVPLMERFKKIIFVSSVARCKWENLGLRRHNTFYIPNTIRDTKKNKSKNKMENIDASRLIVLIVGSFQFRKAQDVVVKTVLNHSVLKENYVFVFLGDIKNDYAQSLVKMSEHCDALTFLEKQDAAAYFPMADIVLQPSRAEAMSRVMLEAMKYGKPLVCTNIEGSSEVIEHMVDGILVPPDNQDKIVDALEYLRNNPAERQRMSKAARVKFEAEYSWESYKKRWNSFIRNNLFK